MKVCCLSFDPVSYFSGIVSEHCCVPEGICEWQLYLQHLMGVQIQSQSDLSVTRICPEDETFELSGHLPVKAPKIK